MPRVILKDALYRQLREQIMSGRIPRHESLTEERISTEFHVSRTPEREALRQMAHEGFAEHAPHCGDRVAMPTPQLVQNAALAHIRNTLRELIFSLKSKEARESNGPRSRG